MDCSVDLKLGGLGDFGLADKWKEHSRASALPPAAASLAKRPRMPGGGSQNVSCLVDGCRSDLSNCREYHRRHKVCEVHSKTPIVLVGGQEQRFCQQCSRFHLLAEFDDVKRSCRKRLDGHNRRRRKPQIDPINPGNLYPSSHGTGFTSYPQTFPASADTTWISIGAGAEDTRYGQNPLSMHFLDRVQPFSGTMGIKEGKQFPFLHSSEGMAIGCRTTVEQTAVCQPLLKTFSPAESSGSKTMFSEGLPPVFSSDCALSFCHPRLGQQGSIWEVW
ncbi:hypothetical protein HPP92_021360 [Vanilla planifolia]|uniref:SBP-type domain-containing protein n=1 Tax=Vanilla planifolia TaxID=51239 RepID=A0A835UH13_VANPL|nr:hypothetical protein HPP92_021360 [Vanilla planifolia]